MDDQRYHGIDFRYGEHEVDDSEVHGGEQGRLRAKPRRLEDIATAVGDNID
jgi:hypothetical protein